MYVYVYGLALKKRYLKAFKQDRIHWTIFIFINELKEKIFSFSWSGGYIYRLTIISTLRTPGPPAPVDPSQLAPSQVM